MARILLSDDGSSDTSDSDIGGADVPDLKVNQEFAKRFEHNKKREELQKLEEKLGKSSRKRKRGANGQDDSEDNSDTSTSSEDEDDDGELATAALDSEIMATLNAIKSKDPRVYDQSVTFYTENDAVDLPQKQEKDKPMYLRDYHRENLLNGVTPQDADEPVSYNQQQDQLKKSILGEIHAAAGSEESEDDSDDQGGLLVRKEKQPDLPKPAATLDVENADRDPETFLSNFMAARAWVPADDKAELHPFESDDEEEERRAEEFEEAYNLRFEDPAKANATLRSYDRATAEKYSVRRDDKTSRQKKRDAEKAAKEAAKQELREERARLKKLRMDEVEEKLRRIKRAAGLKSTDLQPEDWQKFIDEDWDDSRWETEMQQRFGDHYYADQDEISQLSENGAGDDEDAPPKKKKKKPKKPKFDDDIDIKDIIPDFEDEEPAEFSLSENEDQNNSDNESQQNMQNAIPSSKPLKSKSKKQQRIDAQKESRRDRRIIEQLVDDQLQMDLDHALPKTSRAKSSGFRYRETSPQTFGLSTREILLADDAALNEFAGLKKLASWRDDEKKRKDKKFLGKKARLRKWRLETFGNEDGPGEEDVVDRKVATNSKESDHEEGGVAVIEGTRKKGRRRKRVKA